MKSSQVLLIILFLIGCGAMNEPRHKDFLRLERPHGYEDIKSNKSSKEAEQSADSGTSSNNGLFSDVYKAEDKDTELRIKRTIDEAWVLVGKAILLNKLGINGRNRKQGHYRVSYKTGGLLDGFNLFGRSKVSIYLLKLDESNGETIVSISNMEDENDYDPGRLKDGAQDYSYDSSAKLTDLIFDTLYNDVRY